MQQIGKLNTGKRFFANFCQKNLLFRELADHKTFGDPRNGNFLRLTELLVKSDPVMVERLAKVNSNTLSDYYLRKTI